MTVDVLVFVEAYPELLANHDRLVASGTVGMIALFCDDMHYHDAQLRALKSRVLSLPILLLLTYPYVGHWLYPEIRVGAALRFFALLSATEPYCVI